MSTIANNAWKTPRSIKDFEGEYKRFVSEDPSNYKDRIAYLYQWRNRLLSNKSYKKDFKVEQRIFHAMIASTQKVEYKNWEFFSFRADSDYALEDLRKQGITLVNPAYFNDPMDPIVFPWLRNKIATEKKERKQNQYCLMARAAEDIRMKSLQRISKNGEDNEQPNQNIEDTNILMWAHYANAHKGFCIKYKLTHPEILSQIGEDNLYTCQLSKVNYAQKIEQKEDLLIDKAFFTKTSQWKYESEYRIVSYGSAWQEGINIGTNPDVEDGKLKDFIFIDTKNFLPIQEVYLGIQCSSDFRKKVENALRDTYIPLYQMEYNHSNYSKLKKVRIG